MVGESTGVKARSVVVLEEVGIKGRNIDLDGPEG